MFYVNDDSIRLKCPNRTDGSAWNNTRFDDSSLSNHCTRHRLSEVASTHRHVRYPQARGVTSTLAIRDADHGIPFD
jgi:hypothetical protein